MYAFFIIFVTKSMLNHNEALEAGSSGLIFQYKSTFTFECQ